MIPSETWHCSSGHLGELGGSLTQPQGGTVGTGSCAHAAPQMRGWMLGGFAPDPHSLPPAAAAASHSPLQPSPNCTHFPNRAPGDYFPWTDPSLCGGHCGGHLSPAGHYSVLPNLDKGQEGCYPRPHQPPALTMLRHLLHPLGHVLSCGFSPER